MAQNRPGVQIAAKLNNQLLSEQTLAKKALETIITSMTYLARQAIPLRSHDHDDGNFMQLLRLTQVDNKALEKWTNSSQIKTYTK